MLCTWIEAGAWGGGRKPITGPFWFTPGNRKRRGICGSVGSGALGVGWEAGADASVLGEDSVGVSSLGSALETGAVPHFPRTQPPMRRPRVEDLRGTCVAVELVLELSPETTDAESDGTLPAATEASNEREVLSELFARSIEIAGAEMTGGVETRSTLGRTMRRGMCIPERQSPICACRFVGVWMSMPATDSKLSCDADLRRGVYGICIPNMSSAVAGAGSPSTGWEYMTEDEGSDSSGMVGCVAMPSHKSK